MKRPMPALFVCALLINLIFTAAAGAQGVMPIHVPLQRVESDHFTYIYDRALENQMPALIKHCEDAHALLVPVYQWVPRRKTVVMFCDAQDFHNGWATVYPRPIIMIYASDSPPESTIYEPGDYIRRTVFHEYAHILSMDAQYGFDAGLTRIFGRVYPGTGDPLSLALMLLAAPPGVLAPPWYKEGLAIWAETEFVGPGRGRSARVEMIMRMAAADQRLLPAGQWYFEIPEWPYGDAAYLYGLKTMQHIHERYGLDRAANAPGDLSDAVARSFMFGFNNRARSITGKPFKTLVREAMEAEREKQARHIETLQSRPLTAVPRLTPQRLIVNQPKFGPDGQSIYFSGQEEADRDTLFRYDVNAGALTKLDSVRTTLPLYTDLAASGDRSTLYYTRLDIQGRDRIRNELYALDPRNDRSQRVARKGRYRYPAVSPDGTRLAAVVNRGTQQTLVIVPVAEAGQPAFEKEWVKAAAGQVLVHPVFAPDGRAVVYVRMDAGGSQLRRLDLESGTDLELLEWPGIILTPVFHPSEPDLLFVSDKNGVYNLYRMPADQAAAPAALTNMLGGLFSPDFSPDGKRLAAVAYDSHGYYLTVLDYDALEPRQELPRLGEQWTSLPVNLEAKGVSEKSPPPDAVSGATYRSWNQVGLDYWSPWLTADLYGVQGGLTAAFSDPTRFHQLQILGGAASKYGTPIGAMAYRYSGIYPLITLYGRTLPVYYPDLVRDTAGVHYDYAEEGLTGGLSLTVPWPRVDWQADLTVGYEITRRELIDRSARDYRGRPLQTGSLFEGRENSLWGRLAFFNATAFGRSHSLEDGRYVTAVADWADESLGSDIDRTRIRGDWLEYIRVPVLKNHVLKLEGVYARGSGDQTRQGSFGLGAFGIPPLPDQGLDRNISLRGYPSNYQVGDEALKAGAAYRFPIYRFYKNAGPTSPFYFHQIFGEIYYEGGRIKDSTLQERKNDWIQSAGLEVNFSTTLLRLLPVAAGVGVAYAFDYEERLRADEKDETEKVQVYISIKTVVNF